MMLAFVDKSRKVEGRLTSLADIGYLSVGMPDVVSEWRSDCVCRCRLAWTTASSCATVPAATDKWTPTRTRYAHATSLTHALAYSLTRLPVIQRELLGRQQRTGPLHHLSHSLIHSLGQTHSLTNSRTPGGQCVSRRPMHLAQPIRWIAHDR